jgi:hypothetical protein
MKTIMKEPGEVLVAVEADIDSSQGSNDEESESESDGTEKLDREPEDEAQPSICSQLLACKARFHATSVTGMREATRRTITGIESCEGWGLLNYYVSVSRW